ncbi:HPr-rel-A system PqqD family peptide chaperone [Thermovibrio sp.]
MGIIERLAISKDGFIFDPATGNSYTVNSTGLFILNLLREGKSEEEIVDALVENFDVSQDEAKRDLLDFLEQLRINGLLEASNV